MQPSLSVIGLALVDPAYVHGRDKAHAVIGASGDGTEGSGGPRRLAHVVTRRDPELPRVLAAELREARIADAHARRRYVEPLDGERTPRLLEPELLLILERRHPGEGQGKTASLSSRFRLVAELDCAVLTESGAVFTLAVVDLRPCRQLRCHRT
jgi:hypothetical protein